jgi:hypothetical protein
MWSKGLLNEYQDGLRAHCKRKSEKQEISIFFNDLRNSHDTSKIIENAYVGVGS